MSRIVEFLEGAAQSTSGFTIDAVLCFDDVTLESRHDYIQWLFPLVEGSKCVPGSPTLTNEDIEAIRSSEKAQRSLAQAYLLMFMFYANKDYWLTPENHNHLRITRIITSVRMLSGEKGSKRAWEFYDMLMRRIRDKGARVNETSLRFWASALTR